MPSIPVILLLFLGSAFTAVTSELDVRSHIIPRALKGDSDIITFDDMPKCGKTKCTPYSAEALGCVGSITRGCYCANANPIECAQGYGTCGAAEGALVSQWLGAMCINVPFTKVADLPQCAKTCITMASVQKSCALKSWECFCTSDLLDSCLTQCTDEDKGRARAWQTEACGSSPSDSKGGSPVTKTVAAKVTVMTQGGSVITSTIQAAQTAVVNSAQNQNSININTGSANNSTGRNYSMNIVITLMASMLLPVLYIFGCRA